VRETDRTACIGEARALARSQGIVEKKSIDAHPL
jgi:hypothetical protein